MAAGARDGVDQFLRRLSLQDVPRRAGREELLQIAFVLVDREGQYLDARTRVLELLRGQDTTHHRHGDVHDDDVRRQRFRLFDSLRAVAHLRDDFHVGLGVHE